MVNDDSIPIATYRLQFNDQFTFSNASQLVDYFHQLGISHCYASPLLKAKKGSKHGYDVVNYSQLRDEVGTEEQFNKFCSNLHKHGMGLICDIIPNHMYIVDSSNKWWFDVLENGPSSPYANYFDIDWNTTNKVLLPLLEQPYGDSLEKQILKIVFKDGAFFVEFPNFSLPTDPKSWNLILEAVQQEIEGLLPESDPKLIELKSTLTALSHLPSILSVEKEKIEERQREKEVIKKRLRELLAQNEAIIKAMNNQLIILNGTKGDPKSFDTLETFLNAQAYHLCFWRVANDEINYRRFFDVFEFAGLRTENPEVFQAIHELIFKFIEKGMIDGLRIDHVDGLWDPEKYLQDIMSKYTELGKKECFYMIVEKILMGNEKLNREWPIEGSVGYDFLNHLNGIFIDLENKGRIEKIYREFTGTHYSVSDLNYFCKKLILSGSMSSELNVLSRYLDRISEQHRSSRDFTLESLKSALRDVIACFPVYRSYVQPNKGKIHDDDRRYILSAVTQAKRRNPTYNASLFDFIQNILLLNHFQGISEDQKKEREEFVMRFQQLTGPVMAKGIEDTAFYRFFPLLSIAEVGSNLHTFGISIESFHKKNSERREIWPHTMLTTSTHDTKRSEDVRARINVLSELPHEWEKALLEWTQINQKHKIVYEDECIPDNNEEYLLYSTLIGTWPLYPMNPSEHLHYVQRIQAYMEKAIKEAKFHTSWINPNSFYDEGMKSFIQKILDSNDKENLFLPELKSFVKKIIYPGMLNSLSQVMLKLTCPGIPDIYQGNELWDFSLVDPDNRRPVDYINRRCFLESLQDKANLKNNVDQYLLSPEDGRIKLFITTTTLHARQRSKKLFLKGNYQPLTIEGDKQKHVIAFARFFENETVLVLTGRFFTSLLKDESIKISSNTWKNNSLILPKEFSKCRFRNIYNHGEFTATQHGEQGRLALEEVFSDLPLAYLEIIC